MPRFGPDTGPVVVMLLPLFEEHNRTRTFAVAICRELAALGMASVLPDLPGQGESLVPTDRATLDGWRKAIKSLCEAQGAVRKLFIASMRGGAVVDSVAGAAGVWRLSPISGATVASDLRRAELVKGDHDLAEFGPDSPPVTLAGNLIAWRLYSELQSLDAVSVPEGHCRVVRLDSDPAPADAKFPGAPLWRRSEPGHDPALAALLAADIAGWMRACDG